MNKNKTDLLSCWPDGYSRYYTIALVISFLFEDDQLNILDIGGASSWMNQFLSAANFKNI